MAKTKPGETTETVHPGTREAWRKWLEAHHASAPGIWLIYDKKSTGRRRLTYAEAVEEALCFGWIDSRPNKIDDDHYKQLFSPRKPGSVWSRINKERIEKLIAQGLMTPAGLVLVEAARKDGSWNTLDAIDEMKVPPDLAAALAANPEADQYFSAFSNSSKKIILWWIESAKRPETRSKRIEETVRLAAQNLKANHYRQ